MKTTHFLFLLVVLGAGCGNNPYFSDDEGKERPSVGLGGHSDELSLPYALGTKVRIMTADGQLLAIPKSQIDDRSRGPSAMPSDLIQKMSRTEVRDLVEFLAGLQ